jgi:hypothetical protein
MRKAILIAGLILLSVSLLSPSIYCQEKLSIHAKIWKYASICGFADPDHSSGYDMKPTTDKVTLEVTNCKTFEQKHGQPTAVCITLKNSAKSPMDVQIDRDLVGVTLTDKENQTIQAIAKRAMMEGPMGGKKMEFVTKADASYVLKLNPSEEVNIVYLFPKASVGDIVRVGNLKPTKIEPSNVQ